MFLTFIVLHRANRSADHRICLSTNNCLADSCFVLSRRSKHSFYKNQHTILNPTRWFPWRKPHYCTYRSWLSSVMGMVVRFGPASLHSIIRVFDSHTLWISYQGVKYIIHFLSSKLRTSIETGGCSRAIPTAWRWIYNRSKLSPILRLPRRKSPVLALYIFTSTWRNAIWSVCRHHTLNILFLCICPHCLYTIDPSGKIPNSFIPFTYRRKHLPAGCHSHDQTFSIPFSWRSLYASLSGCWGVCHSGFL